MRVRLASEPAPGGSENEDAAFHRGRLVGVLDGVSVPAGVDTGCVHGPAWYVRRLSHYLQELAGSADSLAHVLATAIGAVRDEHGDWCDLSHPNTPAATVALVRVADERLEYLVLCEAHVVLDLGDRFDVITDERYLTAIKDIRQAALAGASAIGTGDHDALVRQAAITRQQRTNQPGGYWIAAAAPDAALQAITGWRPLDGPGRVRRAVLLTDGASCAVDPFGLLDWAALLDLVAEGGPKELIRRVRAAERADPAGRDRPRYKRHDDASVALCLFEEPR